MNNIGQLIKAYRKKANITASSLAKKIGVSQGTISHIETGKRPPSDELLQKIQKELDISSRVIQNVKNADKDKERKERSLIADTGVTTVKIILAMRPSKKINNNERLTYQIESDTIAHTIFKFLEDNKDEINKRIRKNINDAIAAMTTRSTNMQLNFLDNNENENKND